MCNKGDILPFRLELRARLANFLAAVSRTSIHLKRSHLCAIMGRIGLYHLKEEESQGGGGGGVPSTSSKLP